MLTNSNDLMNGLEPFKDGDVVTVKLWRPDVVEDAENGRISYAGNYVDNIKVTLKGLDNIAQ